MVYTTRSFGFTWRWNWSRQGAALPWNHHRIVILFMSTAIYNHLESKCSLFAFAEVKCVMLFCFSELGLGVRGLGTGVLSDLSSEYAVWGYVRWKGKLKVKKKKHLFGKQRSAQSLSTSITSASVRCSKCSRPTHQLNNKGHPLKMDNIWTIPSVLHDSY